MSHIPVLLKEVLDLLDPQPGEFFIDGTLNGGGHAQEIARTVGPKGKVLGVDWDADAVERFQEKNPPKNILAVPGNYADLPEIMRAHRLPLADGLLLDLGFSSEQLTAGRGFSFSSNWDEPLRMTYDARRPPAAKLLRELSEDDLADIIFRLSGERFARKIAHAIKHVKRPIETTGELRAAVLAATPKRYEQGRIDPATRTFQALRIYANGELENLAKVLEEIPAILNPKGRAVIISFHSLEDGLVKGSFQKMVREKRGELLVKKPIIATRMEILQNPRSRSAKLRAMRLLPATNQ